MSTLSSGGQPLRLTPASLWREFRYGQWRRRTDYLIDREMQYRLLRQYLFMLVVGAVMATSTLYVAFRIGAVYDFDLAVLRQGGWGEFVLIAFYGTTSLMVSATVFILVSHYYTHRVAGPAGKLRRTLNQMAAGTPVQPVTLRTQDYLKSLAAAVNHTGFEWQRSMDDIRQIVQTMRAEAGEDAKKLHEGLDAIEQILEARRVFTSWRQ